MEGPVSVLPEGIIDSAERNCDAGPMTWRTCAPGSACGSAVGLCRSGPDRMVRGTSAQGPPAIVAIFADRSQLVSIETRPASPMPVGYLGARRSRPRRVARPLGRRESG